MAPPSEPDSVLYRASSSWRSRITPTNEPPLTSCVDRWVAAGFPAARSGPERQAQIGIGVQIDCDGDPELNVAPSENEDVVITCTVSNSGQLESTISVDYEWQDDDPRVDMSLSEDEFTLAAGAEEEFEATFSGSPRIEADLSLDFDITASISSVMVLPWTS